MGWAQYAGNEGRTYVYAISKVREVAVRDFGILGDTKSLGIRWDYETYGVRYNVPFDEAILLRGLREELTMVNISGKVSYS